MVGKLIGIGAAAKMCGLSERTLRYWESLGLIIPTRMPSGHRKFSKAMIKKIIALKENMEKHKLRINDMVTSSGFMQDEQLMNKVADSSVFRVAHTENLYQDAKKNMRLHVLTGIPDRTYTRTEIENRLELGGPMAVVFADLDNFRRFNQKYGYERGDKVLKFLAVLLFEKTRDFGNGSDFVGHLGSDDFMIVTTPDRYPLICAEVIKSFDGLLLQFYDKGDRAAEGITVSNRKGEESKFPIMTISLSVVTNERRDLSHFAQIHDVASELRQFAAALKRSDVVVDRRSN